MWESSESVNQHWVTWRYSLVLPRHELRHRSTNTTTATTTLTTTRRKTPTRPSVTRCNPAIPIHPDRSINPSHSPSHKPPSYHPQPPTNHHSRPIRAKHPKNSSANNASQLVPGTSHQPQRPSLHPPNPPNPTSHPHTLTVPSVAPRVPGTSTPDARAPVRQCRREGARGAQGLVWGVGVGAASTYPTVR